MISGRKALWKTEKNKVISKDSDAIIIFKDN